MAKPIPIPQGRYLDRVVNRLVESIEWPEDSLDCWVWIAGLDKHGYGRSSVRREGRPSKQRDRRSSGKQQRVKAHRLTWSLWNGDTTKPLDHICENRACVNPSHLRETTPKENTLRSRTSPAAVNARRRYCKRGHPLYGDNLRVSSKGKRNCRACEQMRSRRWRDENDYGHNGKGTRTFRRQGEKRTECIRGHPATPENTYYRKSGAVECRVCHRERERKRQARLRGE